MSEKKYSEMTETELLECLESINKTKLKIENMINTREFSEEEEIFND